jgi:hypothetical protein
VSAPAIEVLRQRFLSKLRDAPNGCRVFVGHIEANGYGRFAVNRRMRWAHRVAWELFVGPIPDGMFVLHRCDNRPCCNVEHLFLGTHADNMADMARKGRHFSITSPDRIPRGARHGRSTSPEKTARGSRVHTASLREEQIPGIRARIRAGESCASIARSLGVSRSVISNVSNRRYWTHVPDAIERGEHRAAPTGGRS